MYLLLQIFQIYTEEMRLSLCVKFYKLPPCIKAGFHLNECNDSAEAARVGACVVGSNVDSPAADLGRIG